MIGFSNYETAKYTGCSLWNNYIFTIFNSIQFHYGRSNNVKIVSINRSKICKLLDEFTYKKFDNILHLKSYWYFFSDYHHSSYLIYIFNMSYFVFSLYISLSNNGWNGACFLDKVYAHKQLSQTFLLTNRNMTLN